MVFSEIFSDKHYNIFITSGKTGTAKTDLHLYSMRHFFTVQK